jgi:alkylation response protein AidB-like acyl-CoA dehydrogenase
MSSHGVISEGLIARITEAASQRDHHEADLSAEISWLHEAGALEAAMPVTLRGERGWVDDPVAVAHVMATIGRASLPLGRLYEGHVNAAQLVGLYGTTRLKDACVSKVRGGALLGVWGADGPTPVIARRDGDSFALTGRKTFCSGLGIVDLALISAQHEGGTWLLAVEASDKDRAQPSQWRVSGMRATASGGYDVSGLIVSPDFILGHVNDYYLEPYFLGGMYRMCAVQSGGLNSLVDSFIDHARQRGSSNPEILHHRVGTLLTHALLAKCVTEGLARLIAGGGDPDEIAQRAVLTREGVERCIVESLTIIDRAAGTTVHREETPLSRIVRDISFYIRQGAIDDRLISVGAKAISRM